MLEPLARSWPARVFWLMILSILFKKRRTSIIVDTLITFRLFFWDNFFHLDRLSRCVNVLCYKYFLLFPIRYILYLYVSELVKALKKHRSSQTVLYGVSYLLCDLLLLRKQLVFEKIDVSLLLHNFVWLAHNCSPQVNRCSDSCRSFLKPEKPWKIMYSYESIGRIHNLHTYLVGRTWVALPEYSRTPSSLFQHQIEF